MGVNPIEVKGAMHPVDLMSWLNDNFPYYRVKGTGFRLVRNHT